PFAFNIRFVGQPARPPKHLAVEAFNQDLHEANRTQAVRRQDLRLSIHKHGAAPMALSVGGQIFVHAVDCSPGGLVIRHPSPYPLVGFSKHIHPATSWYKNSPTHTSHSGDMLLIFHSPY